MRRTISQYLAAAFELVYPRNCQICFEAIEGGGALGYVCGGCLKSVRRIQAPFCQKCGLPFHGELLSAFECSNCRDKDYVFERAIAATTTQGAIRECVHRFKYQRQMWFGPVLAHHIIQGGLEHFDWGEIDGIVPVPLHPRKRREREFNQAEYLADALGRAFKVAVFKTNLRRVVDTATQTRLDVASRAANMRGAFCVTEPSALSGKRLVLVDDVFTTGATVSECARMLLLAGVQSVSVLTVARQVTRSVLGSS
jgi:competence protein ComFC